ncbi:MAG: hypothetical protein HKO91_11110 [Desulfobacterales bacterium]|nr:hypothetical protein [Desulfobacterales bacterium]
MKNNMQYKRFDFSGCDIFQTMSSCMNDMPDMGCLVIKNAMKIGPRRLKAFEPPLPETLQLLQIIE